MSAMSVMSESKPIVEDFQMPAIGGMAVAWEFWERAIIPFLLANCKSQIGIENKTYKTLNKIQYTYLQMIYLCPPVTPLLALRTRQGCYMSNIEFGQRRSDWLQKSGLPAEWKKTCVEKYQEVQLAMGWPGIIKEVHNTYETVGLEDVMKNI